MFGMRCVHVCFLMQVFSNALHVSDTEIVYPKRHHKERLQNDLGTLNQNGNHEEYVTYEIKSKKAHHFLDLKKIDQSHQKFIWLRSIENGKEIAVKHFPTNCYYDGKIRGKEDSYAFISTCSGGLTGTIDDGKIQYDIIPQNDGVKHNFRNVENLMKKKYKDIYGNVENLMRKKYKDIYENDKVKKSAFSETITSLSEFPILIAAEPQYVEYTKKETLYAEIFVSCDYRLLPKFDNNSSKLIERLLNLYGQVDRAYQAINVRIVVVAIEIQTGASAFPRHGKDFSKDLSSFTDYVDNVIKKTSPFKSVNFDNAMFLSDNTWGVDGYTHGVAWIGTICNPIDSTSLDNWKYNDISFTVGTIGHEFGHNMGFHHDQGENLTCIPICLTNKGCFLLNTHNSSRPGFSTCSMNVFKQKDYPCLLNVPTNSEIKVCGNGIPEEDEQCDCGTLEMCKEKGDNCCEPNNCVLKVNAQCSPLKYPECCQPSCLYKKQGTLCREADGDCDLPEHCEGDKPTCPDDKKTINGVSCVRSVKYLRGPSADTDFSSVSLSPPIITQYLKVSPKQWSGNYPCLSIAIEGCPAEQDAKFPPTSITSANLNYLNSPLCITPKVTSCEEDVLDGTEIIYIESEHCEHDYMKFVFGAYGTLTHVCSKKKVCINTKDNLVLRKHCNDETPKFSFTNEKSLQHKKSKKCVGCVSEDGWPENRCIVGLDEECDQSGNQKVIIMSTLDCAIPLLKTLPGSAYSASSINKSSVQNEIYGDGWCPDVAANAWFQINFGQRVEISTLVMAKTKVYTTWFTLQYSDDGDSWNDYLESDPDELKKLKSVCLSGICQETLTEQCRNLPKSDVLDGPCWSILNEMKSNKKKNSICESNSNNIGVDLNGTTCAKNKFCYNKQCKSAKEHGFKCPIKAGKECSGKGACSLDGTCVCNSGYDQTDHCFSKLKPIDGKWGEWSDYTKCSTHCNGIQKRYRFCSNPPPLYGGKKCDGKSSSEQACNELCLTTQIRPPGDKFCIEPETGNCSVADNTKLVFRSTSSHCKSEASMFVFNPKTGSLMHKCSNKFVCPKSGIIFKSAMLISSNCANSSISKQIQRTVWETLQMTKLQKTYCLSPPEGKLIMGAKVELAHCNKKEQRLLMSGLDNGDVMVSFFENFAKMEDLKGYLNYPTTKGFVDNLDFPSYKIGTGAIRMQVYFRAPESGDYFFNVSCNDDCELLYTEDVSDISSAKKIASCPSFTDRYIWNKYEEQLSSAINLKVGKLYYLEIILFNKFALTFGAAAVLLPSGTFVAPISYEYLEKFN